MLLISKMVNDGREMTQEQQILSNAIQLIHIGTLIHQRCIFDVSKYSKFGNNLPADHDLISGNKIALLAGDLFLSISLVKLSEIR